MPASMASTSEKSDTTHGKRVPPRQPHACFLVAPGRFLALFAGQLFRFRVGTAPVAMMRLVVDDDDVLPATEVAADAPHDLIGRFQKRARLAFRQDRLREPGGVAAVVRHERVVVRDHEPRLREPLQKV